MIHPKEDDERWWIERAFTVFRPHAITFACEDTANNTTAYREVAERRKRNKPIRMGIVTYDEQTIRKKRKFEERDEFSTAIRTLCDSPECSTWDIILPPTSYPYTPQRHDEFHKAISTHPSLYALSLNMSKLSSEITKTCAQSLARNHTIKHLALNSSKDSEIVPILRSVATHTGMTHLTLNSDLKTVTGIRTFLNSVDRMPNLESLDFGFYVKKNDDKLIQRWTESTNRLSLKTRDKITRLVIDNPDDLNVVSNFVSKFRNLVEVKFRALNDWNDCGAMLNALPTTLRSFTFSCRRYLTNNDLISHFDEFASALIDLFKRTQLRKISLSLSTDRHLVEFINEIPWEILEELTISPSCFTDVDERESFVDGLRRASRLRHLSFSVCVRHDKFDHVHNRLLTIALENCPRLRRFDVVHTYNCVMNFPDLYRFLRILRSLESSSQNVPSDVFARIAENAGYRRQ